MTIMLVISVLIPAAVVTVILKQTNNTAKGKF